MFLSILFFINILHADCNNTDRMFLNSSHAGIVISIKDCSDKYFIKEEIKTKDKCYLIDSVWPIGIQKGSNICINNYTFKDSKETYSYLTCEMCSCMS